MSRSIVSVTANGGGMRAGLRHSDFRIHPKQGFLPLSGKCQGDCFYAGILGAVEGTGGSHAGGNGRRRLDSAGLICYWGSLSNGEFGKE